MAWRNHETHKEEAAAVKAALRAAGINARVSHGRGTGWAWLTVNIGQGQQFGEHFVSDNGYRCGNTWECPRCLNMKAMSERAMQIVREVTGRSGEYNGCVNVQQQDAWSDKQYKQTGDGSQPITHPAWEDVTARPLAAQLPAAPEAVEPAAAALPAAAETPAQAAAERPTDLVDCPTCGGAGAVETAESRTAVQCGVCGGRRQVTRRKAERLAEMAAERPSAPAPAERPAAAEQLTLALAPAEAAEQAVGVALSLLAAPPLALAQVVFAPPTLRLFACGALYNGLAPERGIVH